MVTEILKQKSLAIIFGGFGCLMLVAAVFQIEDITKFKVSPRPVVAWPAVVFGVGLISLALLTASLIERKHERDKAQKSAVRPIPSREDYLGETIYWTKGSCNSILMRVHTLNPAADTGPVKQLHDALAVKAAKQDRVKLLAPGGEERVQASFQLAKLGVPIRHIEVLENLDISFSVFDSARAVLPTTSGASRQTVEGVTVESTKLAAMLEVLFAELWSRFDVLPHADFVRSIAKRILATSPTMSLSAVANRLKIDVADLNGMLPSFGRQSQDPLIFFLIGRPCSGKTTLADALTVELEQKGISRDEIYTFNDYEALYDRFREDAGQRLFEPADHGGFAVGDHSVLETVLQQANFRLKIAAPFHRASIVEFARNAYIRPFLNFERSILDNVTVVHVKCALETCRARNRQRRAVSSDHRVGYVPDNILATFYELEDTSDVRAVLRRDIVEIETDLVPLERLQSIVHAKLGPSLSVQ